MLTLADHLPNIMPTALQGRIVRTSGMMAAAVGFPAPIGALVQIQQPSGGTLDAEVIGFNGEETLLYPLSSLDSVKHGEPVGLVLTKSWLLGGSQLLGRVLNARGETIDGRPQPILTDRTLLDRRPPSPVDRPRIDTPLSTGIRAIDGLLTCGKGQRMGIFAGSGVGKSVTLGMMARYTTADVNVIALIGERGREVNEFLERDLGPEGMARSVVVVATSDEPALLRTRAALAATSIAEYFRDSGRDVMLIMDSLTRFALAQREIGLAAGEPPTTRGYPPSVFALLPKLVERAGRNRAGSITAFYSVLVEGDDANEPIADCVRGLIDGHTWLSRKIASRNHYPAIDVLESLSRLMNDIVSKEHREAAGILRELLSAYRDHEDLISIGAYRKGSNRVVDLAIEALPAVNEFLRQKVDESSSVDAARKAMLQIKQWCAQKIQK